jgi:PRC-barrel domain
MMMHHTFSRMLLAGSVLLVGQFAIAQQPRAGLGGAGQVDARQGNDPAGRSDASARAGTPNQVLRGSQIIGATVDLRGGSHLGPVTDFVVSDSGCVDYVIASYQGQYVPIPWAAAMYQPGQRILMVDLDAARIHEMPMFRQMSELTNHQFSDRVHTFYRGVQGHPGDQGRTGDANRQGTTGPQGVQNNPQPAVQRAPNRPAVGQQGTRGRGNTASTRAGDRR